MPSSIAPSPTFFVPPSRRRLIRAAGLLAIIATTRLAAADESPITFQPERVTIALTFADSPELLPADRARIRHDIQDTIRRLIGARWTVTYAGENSFASDSLEHLEVLNLPIDRADPTEERPQPLPLETAPDKYFAAAVEPADPGFKVSAREWDRLTDSLGPVASRIAATREEISHALATALHATYRATAKIEDHDGTPTLHFRAAAIPTPDPGLLSPPQGTLFRALLRRRDRDGRLVEVQPVPHTYLELDNLNDGFGTVITHSALRSAFGSRRGLVSAWAVAAPPIAGATRLTLLRETDGVPLSGRRVEIRAEPFQPGQEPAKTIDELLTDRTGTATIPRDNKHPLLWITVKSGTATLMRIPIAPGAQREIELRLGNDQRRLDAEGRLAILTGQLIETVAKRATLLAAARRDTNNGKFDDARAALAAAGELPTAEQFRRRLRAVETPAAKAAEEAGERQAAARIRAFGRKTGTLIDRYLNQEPLQLAREQLEELEQATQE